MAAAQCPVDEQARAQAGAAGEVDEVAGADVLAEAVFGQDRVVGVVADLHGEAGAAQRVDEFGGEVDVAPVEGGDEAGSAVGVDQAGQGHAQAEDLAAVVLDAGDDAAGQGGDGGDGARGGDGAGGEGAPPRQHGAAGQVDGDGGEVVGVDLDADGRARGAVQGEHDGGAAHPVLGGAGLAQQPAPQQFGDQAGDGGLVQSGGRGDVGPRAGALFADAAQHQGQVGGADVAHLCLVGVSCPADHRVSRSRFAALRLRILWSASLTSNLFVYNPN
ncbi:hypothetical protein AC529_16840 [Thermobifida cellulosilytica TB100]|uniref:Uncharacterized protein n=1 Tax=Thermobifida cellulosilytica TB100 TaxID=665004 RepID=A0A147KE78_THECS|nr:hypothetical protein AC529_16840 [Thermobifida cellulosilytica TB100]